MHKEEEELGEDDQKEEEQIKNDKRKAIQALKENESRKQIEAKRKLDILRADDDAKSEATDNEKIAKSFDNDIQS